MSQERFQSLPDVQASADARDICIDRVGVKGLAAPVRVRGLDGSEQHTVASLDMYVGLPGHQKGTHMSRFVEVLEAADAPLDYGSVRALLRAMVQRLEAESGEIDVRFPYFIRKLAPVSRVASRLDYQVRLRARAERSGAYAYSLEVCVAATSLCPCSKEISDYGAHNQRSHIAIRADLIEPMAIEELVQIAEQEASCEVFGLLKRPDEKWVTERAYDNPKFVEDLVRDVAARLQAESRVVRYSVAAENFESIHNHSAYAHIERDKSRRGAQRQSLVHEQHGELDPLAA